jgi:hypothetical protein
MFRTAQIMDTFRGLLAARILDARNTYRASYEDQERPVGTGHLIAVFFIWTSQ